MSRPAAQAPRPGVPAAPSPPGYGPPRAAPAAPGTPRPVGGGPPNTVGAPRPGTTYPRQNAGSGAGKAGWRQDWTNWVLILAFPVVVVGAFIALPGGAAVPVGGFVILVGFAAVPVGLIGKLVRWLRRQMR
jgi:hypothetical protein